MCTFSVEYLVLYTIESIDTVVEYLHCPLYSALEIRAALALFIIVYHGVGSECFYVITISHSVAKYEMNSSDNPKSQIHQFPST